MTPFLRLRQLAAAGAVAPLVALAAPAVPAVAAVAHPVQAVRTPHAVPKSCAASASSLPVSMRLTGLRRRYVAGGRHWSTFRLRVHNRTALRCPVTTVLAYAARQGGLRPGSVQLQWRRGGHWVRVPAKVQLGVLLALAGPRGGLDLRGHARSQVRLRMRFPADAPKGEWVTLSVGFTPLTDRTGATLPWPVGVSDPHVFRVVGTGHRPSGAPRLAETGADATSTLALCTGAVACLASGAALLRRRRP